MRLTETNTVVTNCTNIRNNDDDDDDDNNNNKLTELSPTTNRTL